MSDTDRVRLFREAVREWRACGDEGTHSNHQAGVVLGTLRALAAVLDITPADAQERVRNYVLLSRISRGMIGPAR